MARRPRKPKPTSRPEEIADALRARGLEVDPDTLDALAREAGAASGDGAIDLDQLAGAVERLAAGRNPKRDAADYEAHREAMGAKRRTQSRSARDIGPIPPPEDPERRAECARSFRLFCETYLRAKFPLAWSPDHLELIEGIEQTTLIGGNLAVALPRGSGKTTLIIAGSEWALVNAYRRFPVAIGADEPKAVTMLEEIRMVLEHNGLLAADFPEICYPIRALEGINQRAAGQLCQGERTNIHITANSITLPTIQGSAVSGSTFGVAGITGSIRGLRAATLAGEILRPDLALIDDPQTDESARSESQCAQRERKVLSTVLHLAGPGKRLAALMACTVIRKGDMADRFLTRSIYPEWRGIRGRLMISMPQDEELWAKYSDLYREGREIGDTSRATKFYKRHRRKMDKGAQPSWPERYIADDSPIAELSAVQHAMNLYLLDPEGFYAEYQNDPRSPEDEGIDQPDPAKIIGRLSNLKHGVLPEDTVHLTAFVDVQKSALLYTVVAVNDRFGGSIVHYGSEPEQRTHYYTLRDMKRTLQTEMPGASLEAQLFAGMGRLGDRLFPMVWRTQGGVEHSIALGLMDSAWGQSEPTVMKYVRESRWRHILRPSRGMGITAGRMPMREWARKPGEKRGMNWVIRPPVSGKATRLVIYDTNWWKSFAHARLSAPLGDPSAMTLYGDRPERHRMLVEQLCAEKRTRTFGNGREVDEWHLPPHQPDNHFGDGFVGCLVAASILGVRMEALEESRASVKARGVKKWSDVFAEKQRQRSGAA